MKRSVVIALLVAFVCIFVASCVMDSVSYCPYCSSMNIEKKDDGIYKCSSCNKTFGAKKL